MRKHFDVRQESAAAGGIWACVLRHLRCGQTRFAHGVRGFPRVFRAGATGRRGGWGDADPGFHSGLFFAFSLPGGTCGAARRASRIGFVVSPAPEAGPSAPGAQLISARRLPVSVESEQHIA
jgi:hypothetical protein